MMVRCDEAILLYSTTSHFLIVPCKVLQSFEGTGKGELVMDIELLEAFDDEADQGYYEDETVSPEDVQAIIAETSRFSEGMPMERLPGQLAAPMIDE